MISRRLLRVKVLQMLYAYHASTEPSLNSYEKELFKSIDKAFDLYHYLLLLIIDVADYAASRIDLARKKRMPTPADLHPNTRFIDNRIIARLRDNNQLLQHVQEKHLNWNEHPEIIKSLYTSLMSAPVYHEYMEAPNCSIDDERKLVLKFFTEFVDKHEVLEQLLEEQSIYWVDDMDFMLSMILKTIKHLNPTDTADKKLAQQYKSNDDIDFTKRLFRKAVLWNDDTLQIINEFTHNWDLDRIAHMDVLIMQMALTEVQEFNSIPTKVTLNEYLDIAKAFSTRNSSNFINGVLDKAFVKLKNENKIQKTGRGLIGDN